MYMMLQAMPGPLFNFSAFIGAITAMRAGYNAVVGIICAWFGLFAPGILCEFAVCLCVK
jgi:chromate transporter